MTLFGAIEAGGTKVNCLVGERPERIVAETRLLTKTPRVTIEQIASFFQPFLSGRSKISAIGVGSFGPLNLDTASEEYGSITTTPKPGWCRFNLFQALKSALPVPIYIDTDVNAAALGEMKWGSAIGLNNFLYITIGTGIGGGVIIDGKPIHGVLHPELGHILIPHDKNHDPFPGNCPYHNDCFEGLATGPAMEKRWGTPAFKIPSEHSGWQLEAEYIASALHSLILILSPQRIILGGGVMHQQQLFPMIRSHLIKSLHGYVDSHAIVEDVEKYIVPPGLGDRAGTLGALVLAMQ